MLEAAENDPEWRRELENAVAHYVKAKTGRNRGFDKLRERFKIKEAEAATAAAAAAAAPASVVEAEAEGGAATRAVARRARSIPDPLRQRPGVRAKGEAKMAS